MAMHTWFECKIRYEKVMENGMQKKVTEPYLVDALSFYRSRSTDYRRNDSVYFRRIYRFGHQTCQL